MRIDRSQCAVLLGRAGRGMLATVHPRRGVDAIPACFVIQGDLLAVPIDTVKEKASTDLQRVKNLDADPRASLVCDHWDAEDWSRLWWVRATLERVDVGSESRTLLEGGLRRKYPQYERVVFAGLLTFEVTEVTGWSGGEIGRLPGAAPRSQGV
jgi:hypothetical protein